MARKLSLGMALSDLANRVSAGQSFHLSAVERDGQLWLYFREAGALFWQVVVDERKKGQVSYNVNNLANLHARVQQLGCRFDFILNGERFSSACVLDPYEVELADRYCALPGNQQHAVLVLLGIDPATATAATVTSKILYDHQNIDDGTRDLLQRLLPWPQEDSVFTPSPYTTASAGG